jgi:hypothetical protein
MHFESMHSRDGAFSRTAALFPGRPSLIGRDSVTG